MPKKGEAPVTRRDATVTLQVARCVWVDELGEVEVSQVMGVDLFIIHLIIYRWLFPLQTDQIQPAIFWGPPSIRGRGKPDKQNCDSGSIRL